MDLVSVCITTYNRKALLETCISSILNQTYSNLEIIIIDDCSEDGTEDLIISTKNKDDRIIYIKNKINVGLAAARNKAIFIAKGKYFTFLDDDDEWLPTFVEDFVESASKYPEDFAFSCGSISISQFGTKTTVIPKPIEGNLIDFVKEGYTPPVAGQFYNTETLRSINGYNEKIKTGVDHDLWIGLAIAGVKIKFLDKCLAKINVNIDPKRITQSDNRLAKLEDSYKHWKSDLTQMYGEVFFEHFCEAYRSYEENKIIRNSILSSNFRNALAILFASRNKAYGTLLKSMVVLVLYKLGFVIKRNKKVIMGPTLIIK